MIAATTKLQDAKTIGADCRFDHEVATFKVGDHVETLIQPPHPAAFAGEITGITPADGSREARAQIKNDRNQYRIVTLRSLKIAR